jgi:hypothetical protein
LYHTNNMVVRIICMPWNDDTHIHETSCPWDE